MAKINVLDSSVYNKIAAGEVVERPASIVKELVENSIDAGANKIEIIIEDGGLKSITVIDNGCGIEKDCVETAFLNHATSKISSEKDLEKILTLGFRGEALSSIAAVSKIEVLTKTEYDEFGTQLLIEGGKVLSNVDFGTAKGTSIKIEDLFFNTPARKKFLKKPSGEATEITNLVQRLILANPNVAIKYTSNNNLIFNAQGLGLESAIFAVYDNKTLVNCKKINWFYRDIEIEGYVGNKNFTKPNRTYQTAIVNGRYVSNATISMAVQRAFDKYLTTRAYPFFVLNVKVPFDKIDVNVHPNKMEVKFEDPQSIFYAVYIPIKEMLDETDKKSIPEIKIESEQLSIQKQFVTELPTEKPKDIPTSQKVENIISANEHRKEGITFENQKRTENIIPSKPAEADSELKRKNITFADIEIRKEAPKCVILTEEELEKEFAGARKTSNILSTGCLTLDNEQEIKIEQYKEVSFDHESQKAIPPKEINFAESITIGRVFDTYIIIQKEDDLFFVDQHAAHEALLYKKFKENYEHEKNIKQQLLIPYVFNVKYDEYDFICENIQQIKDCGFEIEEFGSNSFKISEVPLMFANINFEKFINSFLHDLDAAEINIKYISDKIARAACRSAIKAGDKMSEDDINYLKKLLDDTDTLRCPHGRPVVIKISKYEIEKWFKRVI
ncbi:MAG: DNA mismatch repair endonuclease MutL [Clostridiales bacterium]|nr:DNA mismatch repair endonuclease MutL [Clostridiales bacterium]